MSIIRSAPTLSPTGPGSARRDHPVASGTAAVVTAFVGLSLGSTIAKSADAPGAVVAFWRFFIGAVLWHALIAGRGVRAGTRWTATPTAWRVALVPGIAFGVNLSLFFSGVDRTPIAHAEFIQALTPIVMIPLAARLLGERVRRYVVICGAVAIGGIALILNRTPAGGTSYVGDLLVLGAMAAWIAYLLASRSARTLVSTPDFMAVMSTAACVTTLPIALVAANGAAGLVDLSLRTWTLIATLAVIAGMVSHGLIAWAQQRVPVGTISMLQLAQPALGALWAAAFLGESIDALQILGMAVVLSAVGMVARRTAQSR